MGHQYKLCLKESEKASQRRSPVSFLEEGRACQEDNQGKGYFKQEEKRLWRHRGLRAWNILRVVSEMGLVQVCCEHGKKWQACDESRKVSSDLKMKDFWRYVFVFE